MIGLLIQDNAYEQDIRELLMSFYPGETYAHEVKEDVDFYVQTQLENGEASIGIWEKPEENEMKEAGEKEAEGSALKMSAPEGLKDWNLSCFSWGKADLSDHSATKNVVKKLFYQMLVKRTGHVGFSYRYPSYKDRLKPSGSRMEGRRDPFLYEGNLYDQRREDRFKH